MKSKRSKKGEVIEYVVEYVENVSQNEPILEKAQESCINANTQAETQSVSELVLDDAASNASINCSNVNLKEFDNNDKNSNDLFASNNFVIKNRGELPEVPTSIGFDSDNEKVKRSSSIKNFLSQRSNSEVFDKSDNEERSYNKPKKHRSLSLKKRLSFGKKRRSSKLSTSSTSQDKISKSQDIVSTDQNVVLNAEIDNWRMDSLLFNTMEKKNSMQTLSLLPTSEKEEKLSNSNELVKDAKNEKVGELIENGVFNDENPITKESYKLIINVEDSLVVTIQNLDIVLSEKHIAMPTSYPYDDWLFLEICQ